MDKKVSLVIMAAGMGSRFKGLKQVEPVGPNKEFLIDYSIYDAIKVGFNHIVFIIKEEHYDIFKDTIGKRIENIVSVTYVFQKSDNLPEKFKKYADRIKPWGTAHAVMCAKDAINDYFLVINSDDFYGYDAYKRAYDFIMNNNNEHALISYKVKNTLSENGTVKRGVCKTTNGYLDEIIESTITSENGKIVASPLDKSASFLINGDDEVSMNMFCLSKTFLNDLENNFEPFLNNNIDNIDDCEYLLPNVVKKSNIKVRVIKTDAIWMGVTYKEDKDKVISGLKDLIKNNVYPNNLYK